MRATQRTSGVLVFCAVAWLALMCVGQVVVAQSPPPPVALLLPPVPGEARVPTPTPAPRMLPQPVQVAPQPALLPSAETSRPGKRWTLQELIAVMAENYPDLAAFRARADVARGKLIQVGLYPNPYVSVRSDEIGNPSGSLGYLALTVTQEIVTAHKLKLNREAAAHGVAAADWAAMTRWFDVLTRLRLAYVDVLTAQREVQAYREIVQLARDGFNLAEKLQKAGVGSQPDVLRARVELEQSNIRLNVSQRRLEAAWRQLVLSVGVQQLEIGEVDGDLATPTPYYEWSDLVQTVLTRSSEVQEAQSLNRQADGLYQRAKVEPIPNVLVQLRPMYAAPERNMEAMVEIGAYLPFWNRNQGNISSAQADLVRTSADVRTVELKLSERLNMAYQRYLAARQQVEAYRERILKDAGDSLSLVMQGYRSGDPKYDYTAVLQAQIVVSQAKLIYAQALGELWRSVCDVAGLVQEERLEVAEPRR